MPVTTLWGLLVTAILLIVGGVFFWLWIVAGTARELRDFRRWTTLTAIASAVLVLFSAIPFDAGPLKDAAITTNTVGPLALTISVTLASIFYSAGEWFDVFQRFRLLGIKDAKAVWIDDDIHLTPYLPCVSDKACPEFTIGRLGQMGTTITSALEQLLRHSRKITTAEDARTLADQCQPNA
jgi:hypothetical protein